jgi:tetratricopeptide (TPR) repeat protein
MNIAGLHADVASPAVSSLIRQARAVFRRKSGSDTAVLRQVATANSAGSVMAFLATDDTTHLTGLLAQVDTVNSSTWRVADAALALARGDSARARMRVDRHYRTPASTEFTGEQGLVRSYAWGVVLAELREPLLALDAFARLDSAEARIQLPGLLVRSYAKRGEIYQRQGDLTRAVEYYDKFIAAWSNADPELQPQVDRVRKARAAAKGEVWPERRR